MLGSVFPAPNLNGSTIANSNTKLGGLHMVRTSSECPGCGETYTNDDFEFVALPEDEDASPDEYWLLNRITEDFPRRAWGCKHCEAVTQTIEIPLRVLFDLVADSPAKLEELEQYFPTAGKPRAPYREPLQPLFIPDDALACVIGDGEFSRNEVVAKIWAYINAHGLQDRRNKRLINADAPLARVFGAGVVDMFDMAELVFDHLSEK